MSTLGATSWRVRVGPRLGSTGISGASIALPVPGGHCVSSSSAGRKPQPEPNLDSRPVIRFAVKDGRRLETSGVSANGNGGRYHYYACSGRQKYGPKACDGERLPREKIEDAVINQLAALYRDEQIISDALMHANADAEKRRPEFEHRLACIGAEITRAEQALERYYEAFEQGKLTAERCEDRLARLQARLDDLRAQEAELSLAAPLEAAHAPTSADVAEIADVLEAVASEGDPRKAKVLLQLLIDELRVNSRAEILPTYRLVTPEVCAMSEKVEAAGRESANARAKPSLPGLMRPKCDPDHCFVPRSRLRTSSLHRLLSLSRASTSARCSKAQSARTACASPAAGDAVNTANQRASSSDSDSCEVVIRTSSTSGLSASSALMAAQSNASSTRLQS
jgi:exonuclease VII small subunit